MTSQGYVSVRDLYRRPNDNVALAPSWSVLRDSGNPVNALSVDVEEYFQVSAFADRISESSWESYASRVEPATERVLRVLERHAIRATFFVLGWVAERHRLMVRRILDAGHEVASHGYRHVNVHALTPRAFRSDVSLAKQILEDISGSPVNGYRAANFSMDRRVPWAGVILAECGYRYSSSTYPTLLHPSRGQPRGPHHLEAGLLELPVGTFRLFGCTLPCGGGGYFRLAPYALSRWSIARNHRIEESPSIFYIHTWEFDRDQPKVRGAGMRSRARHYLNLS